MGPLHQAAEEAAVRLHFLRECYYGRDAELAAQARSLSAEVHAEHRMAWTRYHEALEPLLGPSLNVAMDLGDDATPDARLAARLHYYDKHDP